MSLNKAREALGAAEDALKNGSFGAAATSASDGLTALSHVQKEETGQQLVAALTTALGLAQVQSYDIGGNLNELIEGVGHLRNALDMTKSYRSEKAVVELLTHLATALVRLGEQTSDVFILQEAISLQQELSAGQAFEELPPSQFKLVNAIAVARLRLGSLTGDPAQILTACHGWSAFLKKHAANTELARHTKKNLIAALTENARQNRSDRVYRELIMLLEKSLKEGSAEDRRYTLPYLATAHLELAGLTSNPDLIGTAIDALNSALELSKNQTLARQSILHSLAQAHFRLAKLHRSKEDAAKAVAYIDRSLEILDQNDVNPQDGRRVRLLADCGTYRHVYGVLAKDKAALDLASNDFAQALSNLAPEAAPLLFVQIAIGQFMLHYRLDQWSDALNVFARIKDAWAIAASDPTLTSEVHQQKTIEMAGHFTRAAKCYLKLGKLDAASAILDEGRGMQLALAATSLDAEKSQIAPETQEALKQAARHWEKTRRVGTHDECRVAWRAFLDLKLSTGDDVEAGIVTPAHILSKVPHEGAVVQLFGIDAWIAAIGVTNKPCHFFEIEFGADVLATNHKLLHGDGNSDSWSAAYDRFVTLDLSEGATEQSITEGWNDHLNVTLEAIGREIAAPIDAALRKEGILPGAAVVLSPPGELAALPLSNALLPSGTRFAEGWDLSVTPNMSILAKRPSPARPSEPAPMLVVTTASTAGEFEHLPFASREQDLIVSPLPDTHHIVLSDSDAGIAPVLDAFESASMVHLATHGAFDPERPEQSCVYLSAGEQLSISRLKAAGPTRKRLVFLSCCESGVAGRSLVPDEFVGLLPSLLQCGFDAAIGTLWPVYDDAAMLISSKFYELFFAGNGKQKSNPARALSDAQSWLKDCSLRDLVEGEYFTLEEAKERAELRHQITRLRKRGKKQSSVAAPLPAEIPEDWTELRLYSNPLDWAGFVLLGR